MRKLLLILSSVAALAQTVNPLQVSGFSISLTNAGGGTTLTNLAKVDSSGHAVGSTTSDTGIPVFIVIYGAGTSGTVKLGVGGEFSCQFDASGGTIGHFVVNSTSTSGRCADAGATAPSTGWVIGIVQTTAAANAISKVLLLQGFNSASTGYTLCASGCNATIPSSGTTISVSTHGQGVSAAGYAFDSASPKNAIYPPGINLQNDGSGNITINYVTAPLKIVIH